MFAYLLLSLYHISNLYHVKYTIMKPKECNKFVYCNNNGMYLRRDGFMYRSLGVDFHPVAKVIDVMYKLEFNHLGHRALAWKDKHGNVVVRVELNKQ